MVSPVTLVPPLPHTHSLIYHRCFRMLSLDTIIKQGTPQPHHATYRCESQKPAVASTRRQEPRHILCRPFWCLARSAHDEPNAPVRRSVLVILWKGRLLLCTRFYFFFISSSFCKSPSTNTACCHTNSLTPSRLAKLSHSYAYCATQSGELCNTSYTSFS